MPAPAVVSLALPLAVLGVLWILLTAAFSAGQRKAWRQQAEERAEQRAHADAAAQRRAFLEHVAAEGKREARKAVSEAQTTCNKLSARFDELDAMLANTIELLGSVTGRVSAIEERLPKPRAKKKGARR